MTRRPPPDHKVYFVPLQTKDEAAYLTAFLNSRVVADAINAYSSALSLGTSVTDYLDIPSFDEKNETMTSMAAMAKRFNMMRTSPTPTEENELDQFVKTLLEK